MDSRESSEVDPEFESIVMLAQGLAISPKKKPSLKTMLGDIEQDLIMKALTKPVEMSVDAQNFQNAAPLIERIKKYDLQTA